jgi:hypothetical protein
MKQTISLLLLFLLLVQGVAATSPAVEYYPAQQLGNHQYYTVAFDGEGEAAVTAKIVVTNNGDGIMWDLPIEIPGHVRLIKVLEEGSRYVSYCLRYAEEPQLSYGHYVPPECIEFGQREYYNNPRYSKLKYSEQVLSSSSVYTLKLNQPLQVGESATILLGYKSTGHAEKSLGVWNADFETIKVPYDVDSVRVAVSVPPDMYLKGGESNIDYQPQFKSFVSEMAVADASEVAAFSERIVYQEGYVKQAYGLDPWESFHVELEYGSSKTWLYKSRVIGTVGGIIVLLAGLYLGIRKIRLSKKPAGTAVPFLYSFGSAALVYGVLFGSMWVLSNMRRWIGYGSSELAAIVIVLVVAVSLLALLFGPSLYLGAQRDVKMGLVTFGLTVMWLVLLGIAMVLLFGLMQGPVLY